MNRNIKLYNGGKDHQPIYKVRIAEAGSKFPVGEKGNKRKMYVEAAKGTNLFFAIYWDDKKGKRVFESIPLVHVVEHQKQVASYTDSRRSEVPTNPEKGDFLFVLSPNDLVYIPHENDVKNPAQVDVKHLDVSRIYRMVSCTGSQCFFIRQDVAKSIVNKVEFSSLNKMEKDLDGQMIKNVCWKLIVDRLGAVKEVMRGN